MNYDFTNAWFDWSAKSNWDHLIPVFIKKGDFCRLLEIGSYEGASACYLIEKLSNHCTFELHCVDTWLGSIEHQVDGVASSNMAVVEARFKSNIKMAKKKTAGLNKVIIHKKTSEKYLSKLIGSGTTNFFDFIYIDGSHQAPDVLSDSVLAFKLLKIGGYMAFDDYLWSENTALPVDPIRCPKFAIDSFVNIFCRKLKVVHASNLQLYIQKISD